MLGWGGSTKRDSCIYVWFWCIQMCIHIINVCFCISNIPKKKSTLGWGGSAKRDVAARMIEWGSCSSNIVCEVEFVSNKDLWMSHICITQSRMIEWGSCSSNIVCEVEFVSNEDLWMRHICVTPSRMLEWGSCSSYIVCESEFVSNEDLWMSHICVTQWRGSTNDWVRFVVIV